MELFLPAAAYCQTCNGQKLACVIQSMTTVGFIILVQIIFKFC